MMEIQGHRGSMGTHKENTLEAFQEGIEAGCVGLELDLRLTKEKEIIIYHDPHIANSSIDSLTVHEIQKMDEDVPLLQELFDFIKKLSHVNARKIHLNLEIKSDSPFQEVSQFAKKVVHLVHQNQFRERVAYSSFDKEILFAVRKIDPKAKIGFLSETSLEELIKIGSSLQAEILSPHYSLLTKKEEVQKIQEIGVKVIPWTVDRIDRLQQLMHMGVDGVITNYPRTFIEYLQCA